MRIDEVNSGQSDGTAARLLGLAEFLMGRARDTAGQKQISMQTFLNLAHNMQIDLTPDTLQDMVSRPPLDGVFMPIEPNSGVIKFKGNESGPIPMPVNKAQDVVAAAAKRAMK
jgi:hypothetical protein